MYVLLFCFFSCFLQAETYSQLKTKVDTSLLKDPHDFGYPLNVMIYQAPNDHSDILLILHGYGGDHTIAEILQTYRPIDYHLISFDFPDHNILERQLEPAVITYGSIQELLPLIYVLKKLVIDVGIQKISIYGFSAGCGAIVNALAVLNETKYDAELSKIGVTAQDKTKILAAIEKGWILLDAPLKSMDEITDSYANGKMDFLTKRYIQNDMRPIDALMKLKGLKLNVIVYFETPDEVVKNRDDDLYSHRLETANPKGQNIILKGSSGGHVSYHSKLWNTFRQKSKK